MNKSNSTFFLAIITLLALGIRIYKLDLLPLYPDESGGHFLQYIWIQSHSFWPNPWEWVLARVTTLTWLLGLNEYGVRLPAVFIGSLMSVGMYWWITGLSSMFKVKDLNIVAILSSLFVAILPWSFMIGRIGHSYVPLMLLSLMGSVGLFLRGKHMWAITLLILGVYCYPSMIILGFFLLILFLVKLGSEQKSSEYKKHLGKIVLIGGMVLVLIGGLFVYKYNGLSSSGRALDLAIWRDVNVSAETNEQRGLSRNSQNSFFSLGLPTEKVVNKLFLGKKTAILNEFGQRYWSFWSPNWLFIKGDPILRHSTGMNGQFFWWLAPFMIFGAYTFFNKSKIWEKWLIGTILLISPIPAAITTDGEGYLLRAITMLPFLTFWGALGIVTVVQNFKSKTLIIGYWGVIVLLFFFSSWNFYFKYFHIYPVMAANSFEDGWRELAQWQINNNDKPLLVIWQGFYPDPTFRFWQQTPYNKYFPNKVETIKINNTNLYKTFDNLLFAWPQQPQDLALINQSLGYPYISFKQEYIKSNPQYAQFTQNKIIEINGKYQPSAWMVYDSDIQDTNK